ncbi:MAG: hypothetical protein QG650_841 [Patescibacteria group bacterium]|nr:hypothetical protein [Patescibacteria group bacterium]
MQTDDFVLYHAYCNDSLNYAFVSRGLARAKFRQGFSRAFVLRGLERAHFENAGLAAIFLGLREREIGKGATWSGTALTEGVFIGPNCFSSSADRVSSSKVSGQQEDSLYRAIILDSAFSQREFIGNTLRSAEFLLGAQGSSFGEFSAKEAIAYPGSLSRATVLP